MIELLFTILQFGAAGFFLIGLRVWFVKDVHRSIQPTPELDKPTKLDGLIRAYMKRDALDPTSTSRFLMEVDGLEDPFAEAPMLPPPKPKDAATSARPPRYQKKSVGNATVYSVTDDLMRAYSVPTHSLQCQLCRQIRRYDP